MQESAILDMFLGNRDYETTKRKSENLQLEGNIARLEDTITEKLNGDKVVAKLFLEYKDLCWELREENNLAFYKEGFSLGLQIGLEIAPEKCK